jgi:CubicO group peptidase (beta-lactamase class C family)
MTLPRRRLFRWSAALAAATAIPVAATAATAAGAAPPGGGEGVPSSLAPDASPRFRAVAQSLTEAMTALKVPGAALGILADGREEHATFGYASTEGAVPVTAETLFQIGSLNKTYTATAAMRLLDAGRLSLDAPVRTYLPELRLADDAVARAVTVRHLLTHTGGWWGDYFSNTGTGDDALAIYTRYVLPTLEQIAPLGGFFSYNNAGFVLLGRVIEVLTGRPYRAALADLVLDPLDLPRSTFLPETVLRRPHATGYSVTPAAAAAGAEPAPVDPLFLPRSVDPAGGLWSTTGEQLRYARFHMGDGSAGGRRLLLAETLGLMQTPQIGVPGQGPLTMGMSWFVLQTGGLRLLYHGGDTFGQHTEFWIAPDAGFALVVFANAQPGGALAGPLAFAEALRQYFGVGGGAAGAGAAAAGGAVVPRLALPPGALAAFGGRYATPNVGIDIRPDGEDLALHVDVLRVPGQVQPLDQQALPPDARATIVAPDVALVTAQSGEPAATIQFLRRPDGSVGWLSLGTRLYPRQDRAAAPAPAV